MPISLNGDGIISGVTTFTTSVTGVTTFSSVVIGSVVIGSGSTAAPSLSPTGDSNTGIFFPSADTIAFAEGGIEAARFDSSGNFGIGTANPSQKLEVVGGEIKAGRVDTGSEGGQISLGRASDNNTAWYFDVYGNTSSPSLRVVDVSNSAVRATFDGSGNLSITNGNLVLASGKGIDFSAASNAAGMTSELLSDYEEGTWTPTLTFNGGTTGITYSTQYGYYTKVGNIVTYSVQIGLSNKGSSTGSAYLTGMPFSLSRSGNANASSGIRIGNVTSVSGGVIVTYTYQGLNFYMNSETSLNNTNFNNNTYMEFSICGTTTP